jgi:predicted DNA-binding WGR domain protein
MNETVIKQADLWYADAHSDKVYHASIVEKDCSYAVAFRYGRRGGHMTEGYKAEKVSLTEAEQVFNKLVASKTKKGYQPV